MGMNMIPVEKPGSPAEILEHHGTKGMRWGVRKSSREFAGKFPRSRDRTTEIARARASVAKTGQAHKQEKDPTKRKELKEIHLNNPDRATAYRMTRGEKIVAGLFATVLSPTLLVPAVEGVGIGATYAVRRRAEKRQNK
jgi:hypothetical protein